MVTTVLEARSSEFNMRFHRPRDCRRRDSRNHCLEPWRDRAEGVARLDAAVDACGGRQAMLSPERRGAWMVSQTAFLRSPAGLPSGLRWDLRLASWAIITALAVLASATPASAQQAPPQLLTYGVTGSVDGEGTNDPGYILAQPGVQRVVLRLASETLSENDAQSMLAGTDVAIKHLLATGIAARSADGRIRLAMNLLTRKDRVLLADVADRYGRSLADAFIAAEAAFKTAGLSESGGVPDLRLLRFAVIGCVILDWDGLTVTQEMGLRAPAPERDGIGTFVPWARESAPDLTVRALYWGSHNLEARGWWFTTFGDHHALPRAAVPDLSWNLGRDHIDAGFPPAVRSMLAGAARQSLARTTPVMARVLATLRNGAAERSALQETLGPTGDSGEDVDIAIDQLLAMNYVGIGGGVLRLRVPVFSASRDARMFVQARSEGRRILTRWLASNHRSIREELSDLEALRAGVAYEQLFTEIWHDLFGWANYHLSRRGWIADPYGPDSLHAGFVPFVWEQALELNQ